MGRSTIRVLTAGDISQFIEVRLRSIREEPLSFGSNEEEEKSRAATIEDRMSAGTAGLLLGAFEGSELVGIVGLRQEMSLKFRHRAILWGVYVVPERRGRGIAKLMMREVLARAEHMDGVEIVSLRVTADNESACRLYVSLGFASYGIEPRSMKVNDRYVDFNCMQIAVGSKGV